MRPVRLFISYASKDWIWRDHILSPLLRMVAEDLLLTWHDRLTETGEEWEAEIFRQLDLADVALLLVSAAFLESDFIQNREIPVLKSRHEQHTIKIYPLILTPCDYQNHNLIAPIQFLGGGRTPLIEHRPAHRRYNDVAAHLKNLIVPLHQEINRGVASALIFPPVHSDPPLLSLEALLKQLPQTHVRLFGRDDELAILDKVRKTKGVLVWVAGGGAGKSALVRHWLVNAHWEEGTRFLGHSFYSQGTKDQNTTSAYFLRDALQQLGCTELPLDNFEQGQLLAKLVRDKPTVLVLDGVEPLQHAPDGHAKLGGMFKDQGLHGLLAELVRQPGEAICLVSSRVRLADTQLRSIQQHNLDHLSPQAAVELIKCRGIHGLQEEMEATAKRYQYHALAMVLVSEYLHAFHKGRVKKALEISLISDKTKAGRHAMSVMRAYDIALQKANEPLDREMVRLLGLFDRPAEQEALAAFKRANPIPGLTVIFLAATPDQVEESLARLRQWGLLNPGSRDGPLDAHPLVREWFGEVFYRESPESFRQAHATMFRYFQQVPKNDQPDTLEEMEPLYRAIRHGCLAGEHEEALSKVYRNRIQRGDNFYCQNNLGIHSSDLSAIANFFPNGFDQMPVTGLTVADQSWLVNEASTLLISLGRLTEAVGLTKVSVQMREQEKNWMTAAISSRNLTELLLTIGQLTESVEIAEKGLSFANRIQDKKDNFFSRTACLGYLGRTTHLLGRMRGAVKAFQQAEALQKEFEPQLPQLYSLRGTSYALLLLEQAGSQVERADVKTRGQYIGEQNIDSPLENALGKLVTGLAMESLGEDEKAANTLRAAVTDMRRSGRDNRRPQVLLAYAGILHRQGNLIEAKAQLTQAQEIAERGEMQLYLAECHLLEGEIALDEGRRPDAAHAHQQAKALIDEMGYERRRGELLLLEARLQRSPAILEQARQQFRDLGQFGLLELYKNRSII